MREFVLKKSYSLSPELFFKVFFEDQKFTKEFHVWKGNKDVDISDWYKEGTSGSKKRICFYTIKVSAAELGIAESSKCLESQVYTAESETKKFTIKCKLTPEISNDLRIESEWTLTPATTEGGGTVSADHRNHSELTVRTEVECLSKVWGVTGMVENMLHDLVHSMQSGFFDLTSQCAADVRTRFERTAKEAAARRMRAGNQSAGIPRFRSAASLHTKLVCGLEKVSAIVRVDDSKLLHVLCVPGTADAAWLERILRSKLWNLNAVNDRGQTALHVAAGRLREYSIARDVKDLEKDQAKILLLLLELGAIATTVDANKQTPIHLAASDESFAAVACLLTSPKVTPDLLNQLDGANKTVLDYIVRDKHPELHADLIRMGAKLSTELCSPGEK